MKTTARVWLVVIVGVGALLAVGLSTLLAPAAQPTPTPGPTSMPQSTATPVPTATPAPTATPTPTPMPDWVIPSTSADLSADQKTVYAAIKAAYKDYGDQHRYVFLTPDASESLDATVWSPSEYSPQYDFLLWTDEVKQTATSATMTYSGTTTKLILIPENESFTAKPDYAKLWTAETLTVTFTVDGVEMSYELAKVPEPALTLEQVILLMSVDPEARTRYHVGEKGYEYLIMKNQNISAQGPNSSHWVIDIRPVDAQNASEETWYDVVDSPLRIELHVNVE